MLKRRINQWKLNKKRKKADMLEAVRLELESDADAFLFRGRYLELEDIEQYWRRKSVRDMRSLMAVADDAIPPDHAYSDTERERRHPQR
jgi:hypothetical protein